MSRVGNQSNTFTTIGGIFFAMRGVLLSAGWTSVADSDGLTYSAAGTQITHSSTGAGGFQNARAWMRLRDPSGRREIVLQNIVIGALNGTGSWRMKVSEFSRFTGGSPAATVTPAASDEQVLVGGGSDASPTGANWGGAATLRVHIVAENVSIGGVWPFQVECTNPGTATQSGSQIFCEAMAPGSYDAADAAPCVWFGAGNALFSNSASGWAAYGTGSQTWVTMTYAPGIYSGSMGVDPVNNKDVNGFGQWSYSLSALVRPKGIGTNLASKGPPRTHPATANIAGDQAFFYLGSYVYMNQTGHVPSVT
jgi:hypothetical protein